MHWEINESEARVSGARIRVGSNCKSGKFQRIVKAKVIAHSTEQYLEKTGCESVKYLEKYQEKQFKLKHFSNRSMHIESYSTECFI